MTDFKGVKEELFCLPMDVRNQLDVLAEEVDEEDGIVAEKQTLTDNKIEAHINDADTIIRAYLMPVFGEGIFTVSKPYFKGPVPNPNNTSAVRLQGIVINTPAAVVTEQWTIVFIGVDAFRVFGNVSGEQGTGTLAVDFTTTNADLKILAVDWINIEAEQVSEGDRFTAGVYTVHRTVRYISCLLATAKVIAAIAATTDSATPGWAKDKENEAMQLLEKLVNDKHAASLGITPPQEDVVFHTMDWTIDRYGRDQTSYATVDNDPGPFPDY